MRKIVENVENQIGDMSNNDALAWQIAKAVGTCHRTMLQVRKRRNISASAPTRSRPWLFTARDAQVMERLMIAKPKTTPKEAAIAIGNQLVSGQHDDPFI